MATNRPFLHLFARTNHQIENTAQSFSATVPAECAEICADMNEFDDVSGTLVNKTIVFMYFKQNYGRV